MVVESSTNTTLSIPESDPWLSVYKGSTRHMGYEPKSAYMHQSLLSRQLSEGHMCELVPAAQSKCPVIALVAVDTFLELVMVDK